MNELRREVVIDTKQLIEFCKTNPWIDDYSTADVQRFLTTLISDQKCILIYMIG